MTKYLTYLIGLLYVFNTACSQSNLHNDQTKVSSPNNQDTLPYDKSKVSAETELANEFIGEKGIETKSGTIYYIEKDKQTITAYENGKIKWQSNIIEECGVPPVGPAAIRFIRLYQDKLQVTFGKHSFATINIKDGETTYLGAD